jgi:hypothetical protein
MGTRKTGLVIVSGGIILTWIVAMGLLAHRTLRRPEAGPQPDRLALTAESKTVWMGIYLSGEKVGHSVTVTELTDDGNILVIERSAMRLATGGVEHDIVTFTRSIGDSTGALREVMFRIASEPAQVRGEGRVEGMYLRLKLTTGGETTEELLPLGEDGYLPITLEAAIAGRDLHPGDILHIPFMNPLTLAPDEALVEVQAEETLSVMEQVTPTVRMTISASGYEFDVWLSEDGVVRQRAPGEIIMLQESREQALARASGPPPDVMSLFSIPCVGIAQHPSRISRLVVRLRCPEKLEIEDERQRRVDGTEHLTLEVVARPPDERRVVSEVDTSRYAEDLAATTFIQSAHPEIIEVAVDVVGESATLWEKAQKLMWWVHRNLAKVSTLSIPSALEVLHIRRGDCNEHAVLLCALTRAAGIPSRICIGVVYMDGAFHYHAWNKVYVGDWVAMDAALGQEVADATHLKLVEGDWIQQLDLMNVLGRLEIDVVDSEGYE